MYSNEGNMTIAPASVAILYLSTEESVYQTGVGLSVISVREVGQDLDAGYDGDIFLTPFFIGLIHLNRGIKGDLRIK